MKLTYDVQDRPGTSQTLIFAFQQMVAIMAATLLVPMLMSSFAQSDGSTLYFDPAAALFGAGIGTLVYVFFTKKKSPVFLGSSFTFLGAYAAIIGENYGYWGVIIGIILAGLVYAVIALAVKAVGSTWVNKLMPAVIIGPIVALIGLSLSSTATSWMSGNGGSGYSLITIIVGVVTFLAIVLASIRGSKTVKLIPFIVGIGAGFVLSLVLTLIGNAMNAESFKIMDFSYLHDAFVPLSINSFIHVPQFVILSAIKSDTVIDGAAILNIAITFVPIAVVELAQHIADHKNLSNIIGKDLITDPGLDNTLLGDGIGSIVGGFFGGAANTTYGESIGCVAITGNASIITIITASLGCMILSFFTPFVAFINSIPKCVMGGACVALYGFIAVSGLQMLRRVDLGNNKNLFVVSAIFVTGIGGLTLDFGVNPNTGSPLFQVTSLATALILGILTNLIVNEFKLTPDSEDTDGLTAVVDNMRKVKVEDTNSTRKKKKKKNKNKDGKNEAADK